VKSSIQVKTELEGKFQVMHYVSSFAAAKDQVRRFDLHSTDREPGVAG
jgi:hypothetical protein